MPISVCRLPLLAMALLVGCQHQPVQTSPPIAMPQSFHHEGSGFAPDTWWLAFDDPALNQLIAQALNGSFDLKIAWDRLREAEAIVRRADSARLPAIDASAGASRTFFDEGSDTTRFSLGISASYDLDLFGRLQAASTAEALTAEAEWQALQDAALLLTADLASTYYGWVVQQLQRRLLDEQLQVNRELVEFIQVRYQNGRSAADDVLRQIQVVDSTLADKITNDAQIQILENRLAVLAGVAPGSLSLPDPEALELPLLSPVPSPGVPSDLLLRRPDLRESLALVQSADLRVAAAVSNQFPRVSISGSVTTTGEEISELFDDWVQNLAANLLQPLFDAGFRKAEVERTKAILSRRLNEFGEATLGAIQEVENAYVADRRQERLVENLQQRTELSSQVLVLVRDRHLNGVLDYLNVLNALISNQQLQRSLLSARQDRIDARITLLRALGGSIRLERPPLAQPMELAQENN